MIVENLEAPWSIDKVGSTFYLTERAGNIVKVENGEIKRQSIELEKELATASEAGLLGFVLAPDFQKSNQLMPTIRMKIVQDNLTVL